MEQKPNTFHQGIRWAVHLFITGLILSFAAVIFSYYPLLPTYFFTYWFAFLTYVFSMTLPEFNAFLLRICFASFFIIFILLNRPSVRWFRRLIKQKKLFLAWSMAYRNPISSQLRTFFKRFQNTLLISLSGSFGVFIAGYLLLDVALAEFPPVRVFIVLPDDTSFRVEREFRTATEVAKSEARSLSLYPGNLDILITTKRDLSQAINRFRRADHSHSQMAFYMADADKFLHTLPSHRFNFAKTHGDIYSYVLENSKNMIVSWEGQARDVGRFVREQNTLPNKAIIFKEEGSSFFSEKSQIFVGTLRQAGIRTEIRSVGINETLSKYSDPHIFVLATSKRDDSFYESLVDNSNNGHVFAIPALHLRDTVWDVFVSNQLPVLSSFPLEYEGRQFKELIRMSPERSFINTSAAKSLYAILLSTEYAGGRGVEPRQFTHPLLRSVSLENNRIILPAAQPIAVNFYSTDQTRREGR